MSHHSPAFLEVKYQCLLCKKKRWVEGGILQELGKWEGLPSNDLPMLKCPFCQGLSIPLGNILGGSKDFQFLEDSMGLEGLRNLFQLQKI